MALTPSAIEVAATMPDENAPGMASDTVDVSRDEGADLARERGDLEHSTARRNVR